MFISHMLYGFPNNWFSFLYSCFSTFIVTLILIFQAIFNLFLLRNCKSEIFDLSLYSFYFLRLPSWFPTTWRKTFECNYIFQTNYVFNSLHFVIILLFVLYLFKRFVSCCSFSIFFLFLRTKLVFLVWT